MARGERLAGGSIWRVIALAIAAIQAGCAPPAQSATATRTEGSAPSATPPALTETFTSALYGYSIRFPATLSPRSATRELQGAAAPLIDSDGVDQLSGSSGGAVVVLASGDVPDDTTLERWTADTARAFCNTPTSTESITLGGEPATLDTFAACAGLFHQWSTAIHDGRGYHVIWAGQRGTEAADRTLFLEMLETFTFGAPGEPSGQPASSMAALGAPAEGDVPIPDDFIGAWYHSAPAFWWFLRAGSPTCVAVAHTDLDCVAYQLVGQPAYVGSATMEGRILHIRWTRGYCAGDRTNFGTGIVGDTLKLFDLPDDCGGADFVLARAGVGPAPSAPPAPER